VPELPAEPPAPEAPADEPAIESAATESTEPSAVSDVAEESVPRELAIPEPAGPLVVETDGVHGGAATPPPPEPTPADTLEPLAVGPRTDFPPPEPSASNLEGASELPPVAPPGPANPEDSGPMPSPPPQETPRSSEPPREGPEPYLPAPDSSTTPEPDPTVATSADPTLPPPVEPAREHRLAPTPALDSESSAEVPSASAETVVEASRAGTEALELASPESPPATTPPELPLPLPSVPEPPASLPTAPEEPTVVPIPELPAAPTTRPVSSPIAPEVPSPVGPTTSAEFVTPPEATPPAPAAPVGGIELDVAPSYLPALERFLDATAAGHLGMCVVRDSPERVRAYAGSRPVEIRWLTNIGRGATLKPTDLEGLAAFLEHTLSSGRVTVFFLEGVEYLVRLHGLDRVVSELVRFNVAARSQSARVWVPLNPKLLSPAELERFVSAFGPPS
jgi:Protein of unknown function (DUF835)